MTLQQIRGAMAKLTSDSLVAAGVPLNYQYFDNVQETPHGAEASFARISISFPEMVIDTVGCEGTERIIGSCNLNLYMPKRLGMKPGEDVAMAVMKAWNGVNRSNSADTTGVNLRLWNRTGPNALGATDAPHQVISMTCAFSGRV